MQDERIDKNPDRDSRDQGMNQINEPDKRMNLPRASTPQGRLTALASTRWRQGPLVPLSAKRPLVHFAHCVFCFLVLQRMHLPPVGAVSKVNKPVGGEARRFHPGRHRRTPAPACRGKGGQASAWCAVAKGNGQARMQCRAGGHCWQVLARSSASCLLCFRPPPEPPSVDTAPEVAWIAFER